MMNNIISFIKDLNKELRSYTNEIGKEIANPEKGIIVKIMYIAWWLCLLFWVFCFLPAIILAPVYLILNSIFN